MVTKTEDVTNSSITVYQYDQYGNVIKTTTEVTKDGETTVTLSESTYDILGRVTSTKSGDSETVYTYDAEGRTLLVNADGMYRRTVYDSRGRTVQEIEDADYNPELDNLPNAYSDPNVGQRYSYDENGSLIKEINRFDLETDYIYSDNGTLYLKHFDIYDYYYNNKVDCTKVTVNSNAVVEYDYEVTDSSKNKDLKYGQYINRITYADGYVEEQKYDKDGNVLAKYADGREYYSIVSSDEKQMVYYDKETDRYNNISVSDNKTVFSQKRLYNKIDVFDYSSATENDVTTINETHFKKTFQTVTGKDSTQYTSSAMTFDYSMKRNDDNNTAEEYITSGENSILSAVYTYDEDNSTYQKSYGTEELAFKTVYSEGNIVEDENNHYTYDEYGELVNVSGEHNSSYTYDSRGNMLTKTVDGETTEFSYDSMVWKDQLTAVDGKELTYDSNGNLISYDGKEYTWSHGKRLESITDGENTYTYKYNSDGIRTSKTINGTTIEFDVLGSVILSCGNMYFQYNNGRPVGFVYKDVQYFYITNLSGDIVGITDDGGNQIAGYSYDEWGKLLSITTAEEGNEEQQKIAELNSLRYRGYYYDNETGYYYLQSRYYDPEIGRFISADSFEYIDTDGKYRTNAYAYCLNNPIAYADPSGTEAGWVSDAGRAVAEIISVIFLCLDALERDFAAGTKKAAEKASENFAALIAAMVISDRNILYPSGNRHEERHKKIVDWLDNAAKSFADFIQTSFYKVVNLIQPDFFFKYFINLVETKNNFYRLKVKNIISISFSIGKNDALEKLADLADGKFKLFDIGSITTGFIFHTDSRGAYIEKTFEFVNDFFGGLSLDIEFNKINFPHIDSGLAVNTDFIQYGLAWYILMIILGVSGAAALASAV